jgi:hypothetical protein
MAALPGAAMAAAASDAPSTAAPSTIKILQQRTADGRTLLTNRPDPGATTQRTWEIEPQPAAPARPPVAAVEPRVRPAGLEERHARLASLRTLPRFTRATRFTGPGWLGSR